MRAEVAAPSQASYVIRCLPPSEINYKQGNNSVLTQKWWKFPDFIILELPNLATRAEGRTDELPHLLQWHNSLVDAAAHWGRCSLKTTLTSAVPCPPRSLFGPGGTRPVYNRQHPQHRLIIRYLSYNE